MGFDRLLPGTELFHRQLVAAAGLVETQGAAAHGVDDDRFAARDSPLSVRRRQSIFARQITIRFVLVHGYRLDADELKNPYRKSPAAFQRPPMLDQVEKLMAGELRMRTRRVVCRDGKSRVLPLRDGRVHIHWATQLRGALHEPLKRLRNQYGPCDSRA
jgi:hypothetical protein